MGMDIFSDMCTEHTLALF